MASAVAAIIYLNGISPQNNENNGENNVEKRGMININGTNESEMCQLA
jgi:hypothetical protein